MFFGNLPFFSEISFLGQKTNKIFLKKKKKFTLFGIYFEKNCKILKKNTVKLCPEIAKIKQQIFIKYYQKVMPQNIFGQNKGGPLP